MCELVGLASGLGRRGEARQARQDWRERHGHHRRGRQGTQVGARRVSHRHRGPRGEEQAGIVLRHHAKWAGGPIVYSHTTLKSRLHSSVSRRSQSMKKHVVFSSVKPSSLSENVLCVNRLWAPADGGKNMFGGGRPLRSFNSFNSFVQFVQFVGWFVRSFMTV